ncbi:MAG TPA: gamma carbonic anhydrase family protein [Vicinamibacterales bacterium]|jgi:carbonic anhydrase/acetyltransferase-like protein (isoleucine patch superfamily)|nr:gamma carbonic anhydrase family protein [Vicinamibacterales bacterium]
MLRSFRNVVPTIDPSAYVDESAQVIGDVVLGAESSIWLNAVVRGDVNYIRIGRQSNLQDGVIVHVNHQPSYPTIVGERVTVGHAAILHGCVVEDRCLIGMGAILLNGSHVGSDSIVAAGTLVPERTVIPPRSLVMGSPGKVRRALTDAELAFILEGAANYVRYRLEYMDQDA